MNVNYTRLSLRPYPGEIKLFRELKHMRAYYEHHSGEKYPYEDEATGGRFVRLDGKKASQTVYLVYAIKPHVMAHEFAHVLLQVFNRIDSHPADGNGEPFCYMLSQLMLEAA